MMNTRPDEIWPAANFYADDGRHFSSSCLLHSSLKCSPYFYHTPLYCFVFCIIVEMSSAWNRGQASRG